MYTKCREADSASWERKWVLKQHDLVVSGMDWHPVTHKLVTCSHDRSAFVWVMEGGEFLAQPQVVILPHRMACLDVKWSPDGAKFAVASGSKKALIAFYEPSNNWWVAREGRKHKSTVLAVAWHPSSQLLATVATDYVCRVSSAYVEGVDSAPADTPFGALPEAGEVVTEFEVTRAWLNDCAWSPCGSSLAFVGHDSLLHVVSFVAPSQGGGGGASSTDAAAAPLIQTIKCPTLPSTRLLFLSPTALVTVGHAMNPELYARGEGGLWNFITSLDKKPDASAAKASTGVAAARALFTNRVSKGQSGGVGGGESELWTKHHNAIVGVKGYHAAGGGRECVVVCV